MIGDAWSQSPTYPTPRLPARRDNDVPAAEGGSPTTQPPRIWLVLADKLGDNAQVQIIADALGLPYEVRRVQPKPEYVLGKPPFKASLYHLDLERSDRLEPPWPDLVFTVGRRPSMAAMWIRRQSGGRAKVVLLGRPKQMFDEFALIIATVQYQVPERRNVLRIDFPLVRVNPAALEQAREAWRSRFAPLPRPLTAVLVGGPTKPYIFDAGVAKRLIEVARRNAGGGTLFITTSRRTPEPVVEALQAGLPSGGRFYRWTPEAAENPYLGLLELADRYVVTGDSISMMVEVARLGKPLAIFPLPTRASALTRLRQVLSDGLHFGRGDSRGGEALGYLPGALQPAGRIRCARDLTQLHRILIERGLAVRLGEPFPDGGRTPVDELPRVVARVMELLG